MIDTALLTTVIWITLVGIGLTFAIGLAVIADQAMRHREARADRTAPLPAGTRENGTQPRHAADTAGGAAVDRAAAEKQPV
ncbi:hypothetical protein HNR23_002041 [Nocardiopsis mwathae]|uniref:Uncharacterized protein n=1 Tax=Nocardiopsis mwathae TaxID=1472723 RepID=A0A7X0D5T0_9ACTN|nr:hypothetical protein [Nocardiopsis mwathae]MBB6171981.1 hypothetical protein [Nocardiopsis mwathae]